jgi:hypothetical protein
MTKLNRTITGLTLVLIMSSTVLLLAGRPTVQGNNTNAIPGEIDDADFWRIISDFSEPNGTYPYENYVSNEPSVQYVIPALRKITKPGGVYLGVAPEQNFTYIYALQPKIAFIMDIRRQNMLELLMYKTLFELSPNRADFVARLFSRKRPANLDEQTSAAAMFAAFNNAPKDDVGQNLAALRSALTKHGYGLSSDDLASIDFVYQVFYRGGPTINYEFMSSTPAPVLVNYQQEMSATDPEGKAWSFLGSEEAYRYIREMERKNLIIPLVGDFSGPKTIRRISEYVRQRNSTVTTFYLSNVEMYLEGPKMKNFQENVATLPMDSTSTLIRWVPNNATPYLSWYTPRIGPMATGLQSMNEFVELLKAGRAPTTWFDAVRGTRDPETLAQSAQDPSLRRVAGRVTGVTGLKPGELIAVELVENLRGSGMIFHVEAGADGSFEFRNVQPRTYQAIVLKTCRNCQQSTGVGAPVPVVVGTSDVTNLQLPVR